MPLLADHERSTSGVIGRVIALAEDTIGVKFRARFGSTAKAQEIRRNVLEGHIKGVSYGYLAERRPGWHEGRAVTFIDRIRRLVEVTISPWPVNRLAQVTGAKAGPYTPAMPLPAASRVLTVSQQILEHHDRPRRQELARKARFTEDVGWPPRSIVDAVGVEAAYGMAMVHAAGQARVDDERTKAQRQAQRDAEAARQLDEIHERAARPCGRCHGCRHQLGRCDYR
jgi:HK97 family phage prohead protease